MTEARKPVLTAEEIDKTVRDVFIGEGPRGLMMLCKRLMSAAAPAPAVGASRGPASVSENALHTAVLEAVELMNGCVMTSPTLQRAHEALRNALIKFAETAAVGASVQPVPASLSDEQIDGATHHIYCNGRPTPKEYRVGVARAVFALATTSTAASEVKP